MTADPDLLRARLSELAGHMRAARFTSQELLAETVHTAEAVAATHEEVAETLEMLAQSRPDRTAEYMARSQAARQRAERHRQWAREHSAPGTTHDL